MVLSSNLVWVESGRRQAFHLELINCLQGHFHQLRNFLKKGPTVRVPTCHLRNQSACALSYRENSDYFAAPSFLISQTDVDNASSIITVTLNPCTSKVWASDCLWKALSLGTYKLAHEDKNCP